MTLINCLSELKKVKEEIKEINFLIKKIPYYAGMQVSCINELETKKSFLELKKENLIMCLEHIKNQIAVIEGNDKAEAIVLKLQVIVDNTNKRG